MDFHLKQWRDSDQQQHESDSSYQQQQPSGQACALPLFTPEPTTTTKLTSSNNLSADSSTTVPTRLSRMGGSCCFSMVQWQELELQALIFRHMLAGAAVPPELLHLVKKSLLLSSSSPYYLPRYPPHYQPALMQSGYWGRGAMDPEPGRCRRTDGKKWRCSRDVMGGHKYCERHMHRGRNRSRKPVEVPTPTSAAGVSVAALANKNNNGGGGVTVAQPFTTMGGGSGGTNFGVSGPSHSLDLLRYNQSQSASESIAETKGLFRTQTEEDKSGGRILRHFFDDWPRSGQEPENTMSNACPGTCLSISVPGNPSSDFALKLSTGNDREESGPEDRNNNNNINVERERAQVNWGSGSAWGTNQMGGPLAEALRSSTSSTSSPTSVLHQLRGSNYIST